MQKNLAVSKYRNGDPIPTGLSNQAWVSATIGAFAIYNDDFTNDVLYGKLYNWFSVSDSRGLCPIGWHVPNNSEWSTLSTSLGGVTISGGAMKSIAGWNSPNIGATNESGFAGLPGGVRTSYGIDFFGDYLYSGDEGYWWSSSEYNYYSGFNVMLTFNSSFLHNNVANFKQYGFNVRCVRD
jgi:uncharacterized protein (TIGR02145 family)